MPEKPCKVGGNQVLAVAADSRAQLAVRPSKNSKRRAAVLVAVHLLIAAHIAYWLASGSTVTPLEPSEAMEFSKRGIINAGLLFFAAMIVATAVFGRFFCGWGCHLVALQDLCRHWLKQLGITPRPLRSRLLAWVPLLAFLYMFIVPLVDRLLAQSSLAPSGWHLTTDRFWATFPDWPVALLTFLICGFASVYFLGAKGFCTYACPYGAVFGLADRLAPGRIRVTDACRGCAHCTAVCSSNVRVHEEVRDFGMVVDPGCMKCMDCVSVCPNDALYFGFGPPPLLAKPAAKPRPKHAAPLSGAEEATLAALFVLALFSFRGLYGQVPFLFSLGLAGMFAYLTLQALRLIYRPDVSLLHWPLKRGGRLIPKATPFFGLMAALLLIWIHSGVLQVHGWQRRRLHQQSAAIRSSWSEQLRASARLTAAQRALVDAGIEHGRFIERWGLLVDPQNDLELAWFHLLRGEPEPVEQHLRRALPYAPYNAAMRLDFGNFLLATQRPAQAAELFRAALELDPELSGAQINLGLSLALGGDLDAAARSYRAALARQPQSALLHYNAGLIEAERGDLKRAAAGFQKALELDASLIAARRALARALCAGATTPAELRAGIEQYERALRAEPEDAESQLALGLTYLRLDELDRADQHLLAAVRLAPRSAAAHRALSELYERTGDRAGATRHRTLADALAPP